MGGVRSSIFRKRLQCRTLRNCSWSRSNAAHVLQPYSAVRRAAFSSPNPTPDHAQLLSPLQHCRCLPDARRTAAGRWATWSSNDGLGVYGTLGGSSVSYVGSYLASYGVGGIDFWNPASPYTQGGLTAPTNTSFIQVNSPIRGTIVFGAPVVNPVFALISVGQGGVPVSYTFNAPFTVVSNNTTQCAYWGCGSYSVSGNTLVGREFSGTLQFPGTFSSLDVETDNPEFWHGFTVGAESLNVVPEPSTYALLATGLAGIAGVARRRRGMRQRPA